MRASAQNAYRGGDGENSVLSGGQDRSTGDRAGIAGVVHRSIRRMMAASEANWGRLGRLASQVKEACAAHAITAATVLVGTDLNKAEVEGLLACREVVSLILVSPPVLERGFDRRILGTFDANTNVWDLPAKLGHALVVIEFPQFRPSF